MPFGHNSSPATFERLIDLFRAGLEVRLLAYSDDIISFPEHSMNIWGIFKKVFDRIKKCNLHENRTKCCFACKEVSYLVHVLAQKGIRVNPNKVSFIADMPSPNNVKYLKSFLQTLFLVLEVY